MCLLKFLLYTIHVLLQDHQSDVQLLPLPLFGNVDLLMDLLCVSEADSTFKVYYAGFMRWKKLLQMVLTCWIPRKSVSCCIYLSSLIQTSRTISPVTTAYTERILFGKTSPTNSLIAKNVCDGAKRWLVTPIEKKEPITTDMLLKLYNSVFKENNLMLQRIMSSCLLAFAEFLRVSEVL
jgi:hypothetical protein